MSQSFSGTKSLDIMDNKNVVFLSLYLLPRQYENEFFSFIEEGTSDVALMKGETVIVIGNSPRRGYLVVEKRNHTIHVPYMLLAMK